MQEKILTTEQVANILQVHPFTILKFIKQGTLKGIKLGRVYRIKESDVEQFLEERMTKTTEKKQAVKSSIPKPKEKEEQKQNHKEAFEVKENSQDSDDNHYYII